MKVFIALTVAGLLLGAGAFTGQDTSAAKSKPMPVKKVKKARKVTSDVTYVDVTGSHIKRRVEKGKKASTSTLNVTVIDPKVTAYRGLTPMEVLTRNPTITAAPGWK